MQILFMYTDNSYRSPVAGTLLKKVRGDLEDECMHRIQVWDINDLTYLPYGSDKEIFEEIKLKILELAESIKK